MAQEPEELKRDIEATRAEMQETVDAIQERLSPENVKEELKERAQEATGQAKDWVQDAATGQVQGAVHQVQERGNTMIETIKQNPLPAAVTAFGIGWLWMSRNQRSDGASMRSGNQAFSGAQHRIGEAASGITDAAGSVQHAATHAGREVQGEALRRADQAQQQTQRAKGAFERMLNENPLVVGALALGAGVAVGLAIPGTEREDELMGETREQLVTEVQQRAQEVAQKVEQVAGEAVQQAQTAAVEGAREQGLS